jgi:hypothetical protein
MLAWQSNKVLAMEVEWSLAKLRDSTSGLGLALPDRLL